MTTILASEIIPTLSLRSFAYRVSNKIFEVARGIYRLRDNNFICEIARLPPRVSAYLWHGVPSTGARTLFGRIRSQTIAAIDKVPVIIPSTNK